MHCKNQASKYEMLRSNLRPFLQDRRLETLSNSWGYVIGIYDRAGLFCINMYFIL